jgi:nitronate monooxygenase
MGGGGRCWHLFRVNADSFDANGGIIPQIYHGKTRRERHEELLAFSIRGGITQAQIAHEVAGGNGLIDMNILWEMGGAERVLEGVLEGAKGLINGVTWRCGHALSHTREFCSRFGVYYDPHRFLSPAPFAPRWKRAGSQI